MIKCNKIIITKMSFPSSSSSSSMTVPEYYMMIFKSGPEKDCLNVIDLITPSCYGYIGNDNKTFLIIACERKMETVCEKLLKYPHNCMLKHFADINDIYWVNNYPLIIACKNNMKNICEKILDYETVYYEKIVMDIVAKYACEHTYLSILHKLVSPSYNYKLELDNDFKNFGLILAVINFVTTNSPTLLCYFLEKMPYETLMFMHQYISNLLQEYEPKCVDWNIHIYTELLKNINMYISIKNKQTKRKNIDDYENIPNKKLCT